MTWTVTRDCDPVLPSKDLEMVNDLVEIDLEMVAAEIPQTNVILDQMNKEEEDLTEIDELINNLESEDEQSNGFEHNNSQISHNCNEN